MLFIVLRVSACSLTGIKVMHGARVAVVVAKSEHHCEVVLCCEKTRLGV